MLFSFIVFVPCLSREKNKNKQKEAGFGPFFFKKRMAFLARYDESRVMLPIFEIFFTSIESVVGGYFEKQTKNVLAKDAIHPVSRMSKSVDCDLGRRNFAAFFLPATTMAIRFLRRHALCQNKTKKNIVQTVNS